MKQLVRIQIMDKPDVALLSPSQAYFLRENLKLRLLSARHALLARDGPSFKADLDASMDWISRYYDNKSEPASICLRPCASCATVMSGLNCRVFPRVSMRCAIIALRETGETDEGGDEGGFWLLALFWRCRGSDACGQI